MAIQGTISEWDQHKGYGYIAVDDQEAQIRFHLFLISKRLVTHHN
ncbi:cold shock domain-containing protein [Vibrio sinaloensis]|nr:cold shock domain-containing protein [Vibrio sinaloensis]